MNPEKYRQNKHEEAIVLNEKVDDFYKVHPRTKKDEGTVADELIKSEAKPIPFSSLPNQEQQWHQNMRSAGVKVLEDGFLEINRWDKNHAHTAKPKRSGQKVDGIDSALRMQGHILSGYRNENPTEDDEYSKIERAEGVIEHANELLTSWKTADKTTREELQQQLAEVVLELEKCRNGFKVEAKNQAAAIMKLKDSRGRENPSALAARTVAALNNLTDRINELQIITPRIALRKEILILERRRMESSLHKANSQLNLFQNHAVFSANSKRPKEALIKEHEVEILNKNLDKVLHYLNTIYIAPYLQQATQAKYFLEADVRKYFTDKETVLANLPTILAGLKNVQEILNADVDFFG